MLKSVKINNFKCLYGDINIDLKIDKRTHSDEKNDFSYFKNNNLTKVLSIYGANASGKTTILEAIYVIGNLISGNVNNIGKIRIGSHALHTTEDIVIEFEFFIDDILYKYEIKISGKSFFIEYERLRKVEDKKHKIIYTRQSNTISIPSFTKKEENKILDRINISPNLSVNTPLSIFLKDCELVSNYFKKVSLIKPVNIFKPLMTDHTILLPKLFNELSDKSKKEIIKYFKKADFSIVDLEIKKIIVPGGEEYKTLFSHRENGKNFKLQIIDESYGTTQFLAYLTYFFSLKEKGGGVILIDEFDSSFHPLLLNELIRFFISESNENIQVIFNTHDISILYEKDLYKDQISFISVDREDNAKKVFYKLSDFGKKIRDEYDWLKMYMLGELGATPILF